MDEGHEPSGPLAGIVVADFSHGVAGPFGSMYLADLGATVIKVERPARGDGARYMTVSEDFAAGIPEIGGDYFLGINRNKLSVALDLKSEEGAGLAAQLAASADVVVENFSAGVMERLGLGYEALTRDNPRLVYCSVRAYDERGPLADEVGMDVAIQARSGVMSITGEPGSGPVKPGSSLADLAGGLNATVGILAALLERTRTGTGKHVEVSLLDATSMMLVNYSVPVLNSDVEIGRMGSGHPQLVPFRAFEASDGWIVVAAGTNDRWRRYCEALGRPELTTDPRFASNPDRVRHRGVLEPLLEAAMAERSTEEWTKEFRDRGVPYAPILTLREAFEQPQLSETGMITTVPHRTLGSLRLLNNPVRLDGELPGIRLAPPALGEHTTEVLTRRLGLPEESCAELIESGAAGSTTGSQQ